AARQRCRSDLIGPLNVGKSAGIVRLGDLHGKSNLRLNDPGHLPAANELLKNRRLARETALSAEREFVKKIGDESLGDVITADATFAAHVIYVLDRRGVGARRGVNVVDEL